MFTYINNYIIICIFGNFVITAYRRKNIVFWTPGFRIILRRVNLIVMSDEKTTKTKKKKVFG